MDKAPDAFRTISEVADELDIPQHVLRFWETRFTQIKPMKRSGGRRFYRPDDVDLLRGIRRLLYAEGYTIRGVQRILKEQGIKAVQAIDASAREAVAIEEAPSVAKAAATESSATNSAATKAAATKAPAGKTPAPRKTKAPPVVVAEAEIEEEDVEEIEEDEETPDEGASAIDETSIVVSPPLPKPFTTPLPALELRRSAGQATGMIPRSAMPPEVVRPPKIPPVAPPPAYLPDIMFDTPMPYRASQPQPQPQAAPEPVADPVIEVAPKLAPLDGKRLRPVLDELMAVRRLLDAAMLGNEP